MREVLLNTTGSSFSWRGGARLGVVNATYPFVSGRATREAISLSIPALRMFLESEYAFPANAVIAIERYVLLPFFAWGVRIHHCVPHYPSKVILWTFGNPNKLLDSIAATGFQPQGRPGPMPSGATPSISMPWGMLGGGVWGVLLGFMFKLRLLPFLRDDTILSGGKRVPTAQFAAFGAQWFFVAGGAFLVISLLRIAAGALKRRK